MNKDLIINVSPKKISIALLEDDQLMEINEEKLDNNYSVGDLYLGKVKKVTPGLNAAFVDVGHERDAFLHYHDLGPKVRSLNKFVKISNNSNSKNVKLKDFTFESEIVKTGKIQEVLSVNQTILVQVAKEPISSKGPRITSEIALAGRYVVLVPFSNRISVSQKIKDFEERNRLKRLVKSIRPTNFGVIIRTSARDKRVADILADIDNLEKKWNDTVKKLNSAFPPEKVHGELGRTSTILRDLLNKSFNSVVVDDSKMAEELKTYISSFAPDRVDIVKFHKTSTPVFEQFNVDKQIKGSFGKKVTMKSGAYLIIEHTEAMHVIDVNSGHRIKKELNQEDAALQVNMISAKEIARQLRLRDMGGIIVVDFIDMTVKEHRTELYNFLKAEMKGDKAKHTILPVTKFGLIQITRQRVRPEMEIETQEKCPVCHGSGEVKSAVLIADDIENNIRFLLQEQNEKTLTIRLHPFIYAHFKIGLFNFKWKWFKEYRKWVNLIPDNSYHFLEYHFFNKQGDEIKL